jgi:Mg2+ and Co2+ transporter CorA
MDIESKVAVLESQQNDTKQDMLEIKTSVNKIFDKIDFYIDSHNKVHETLEERIVKRINSNFKLMAALTFILAGIIGFISNIGKIFK